MSGSQDTNGEGIAPVLARLRSARIDGRTENVRYRQDQLQRLHSRIVANQDEIRGSLRKDSGYTSVEVDVEFAMALKVLRDNYDSLNFDKFIDDEYKVTKGKNYSERRLGWGIVYIQPGRTFPVFSIFAPLCAAIAAGNCVLILLGVNLRYTPVLLCKLLSTALDGETFAVIDSEVKDAEFLSETLHVIQDSVDSRSLSVNTLHSRSTARTVAVVDKTADLDSAAECLVRARFAFDGESVYSPDLVLVDEFVKKPFLEAAARHATSYSSEISLEGSKNKKKGSYEEITNKIKFDSALIIVSSTQSGCIVDISSRQSTFVNHKMRHPILIVSAMTSAEDAITFLNSMARPATLTLAGSPYLASYIFGHPDVAKFLSQFINAEVSFIGTIPAELLVGPAAPYCPSQPINIAHRYVPSMFEIARPQYVTEPKSSSVISSLLRRTNIDPLNPSVTQLLIDSSLRTLAPTRQPLQAQTIGFFEQGILVGLGILLFFVVLGLGIGTYHVGSYI